MLVLTRKANQSIMIGDDIEIRILSVVGEKVRVGITAPRSVPVYRDEVYLEIVAERGGVDGAERPLAPEVDAALAKLAEP